MRKVVLVGVTVLALAVSSMGTSWSASASTPVVVRLPACEAGGGETTVPAGSEVILGSAWVSMARAGVMQFLDAVEPSVTIDGVPLSDADLQFGPITRNLVPIGLSSGVALPSYWGTQWSYALGTFNEGDEVVVETTWLLTKRILDVNLTLRPPAFWVEAGVVFGATCTIRAVSAD